MDEISNDAVSKPLATVEVKGNAIAVGLLQPENIKITGNIDQLDNKTITPNEYEISYSYEKMGGITNYTIEDIHPSTISVYVDREVTEQYEIVNKTSVDTEDYVSTTFSQQTVSVTGPETLVQQIASVEIHGKVSRDETTAKELIFLDSNNNEVDMAYIRSDIQSVDVTATVLPTKTVSLKADLKNAPEGISSAPTFSPPSIKIAGPQSKLDELSKSGFVVGAYDYSEFKNTENKITVTLTPPEDCKIIPSDDEDTAPTKATMYMNLSLYESETITANITYENDDYYFEYLPSASVKLTICGDEDELSDIKKNTSDISVKPDFEKKLDDLEPGQTTSLSNIPLKITLPKDDTKCWVNGTYTIDVKTTKKYK